MKTQRIEILLDEKTIRKLDVWRSALTSQPSRSEAVRMLLEKHLTSGRGQTLANPTQPTQSPSVDRLGALFTLEGVPGFGPVKFRAMHDAGIDPNAAIENPDLLPFTGRIGEKLRSAIFALSPTHLTKGRARALQQLERARDCSASILVHGDAVYPRRVYVSNNPVPVLYVRGDPAIWDDAASVAVVGSRNTRDPYASAARQLASIAAQKNMVVVSGFAIGADSIGHTAAWKAGGRTVCVMPCGLDNVFPPENRDLWEQLLDYPGAAFVSEFGFGQRASSLLLRKRNKLIVAFSQGILIAQSADNGGAMNAYRFGRDQKKPVSTFKTDGSRETSGNAAIERDMRTGDYVFELTATHQFEAWLEELISWT